MLELLSDDFTDGDRTDAQNSLRLLRSAFTGRRQRFYQDEMQRLQVEARTLGHYSNENVSRVAVRALERQVTGVCDLLTEGE
jgi:hypothetical protein